MLYPAQSTVIESDTTSKQEIGAAKFSDKETV